MTTIPFTKMVGTGNDFIVVDARQNGLRTLSRQWPSISQSLCDRHHGIGSDGILLLEPSVKAHAKMRVFNADGSEAQMCGNGARCVALLLANGSAKPVTLETLAGVLSAEVHGNRVAARMMDPTSLQLDKSVTVKGKTLRYGFLNTGVPHVVTAVTDVQSVDVDGLGRALRYHKAFAPHGTNVNFIQRAGAHALRIRTYERGVEGETLACGTGMVAAAIVSALSGTRKAHATIRARMTLEPRSGDRVVVSFRATPHRSSWKIDNVLMEGSAQRVFDGRVEWSPRRSS